MALRELTADDFDTLDWAVAEEGGWRIMADVTCDGCGAYQAADCDPTTERGKPQAVALAVRLFNSVGWRVTSEGKTMCATCAAEIPGGPARFDAGGQTHDL